MLQHFSELIDKVKAMPRTVVCVANADSETVEAARMALDKGLADVILYGDEAVVRPLVEQAGIEGRAELRHAADRSRDGAAGGRALGARRGIRGTHEGYAQLFGLPARCAEQGRRAAHGPEAVAHRRRGTAGLSQAHLQYRRRDEHQSRPCRQEGHPRQRAAGSALVGLRMPQGRLPRRQRARRSA